MDEVNVHVIDRCHELRQGVELGLGLSPVVARSPIAHHLLELRELYALRPVGDRLPVGPPCRQHAAAEVDKLFFRNVDVEWTDCAVLGGCARRRWKEAGGTHGRRARKKAAPVER